MGAVRPVEQIPWKLADKAENDKHKEISHPVTAVRKTLGHQKGENRKGNPAEATQRLIHSVVMLQQKICAVVGNHRDNGQYLQRASAQPQGNRHRE